VRMELTDNGCLKILLSEEDLEGLGLTFERLDYDDPATRDAMKLLLAAAQRETGFDPSGGLIVEALPVDKGCLLLFTPASGKRKVRMKRAVGPYIYELDDADQLLSMARSIGRRAAPITGSSLYRFGGGYRLILYPSDPLPRGMGNLLLEFARAAGEGDAAAAYTAEHGQPIAVGDALSRLCSAAAPQASRGITGGLAI
jgi:negative regulator of genetic competence, sporulation and motility